MTRAPADGARAALGSLAAEARGELARIALWWGERSPDHARGGFVGCIDANGRAQPEADKAVILNTRILWFMSAASREFGDPTCTALAQRAADYLSAHFVDARHGGLFWTVGAEGRPVNRRKQAYAQAFGIYAFAEHFAACRSGASLEAALSLFTLLETRFAPDAREGFIEARGEDFGAIGDLRLSERDRNAPFSMNTHLHVLEAYAALCRVHRAPEVAAALERALRLILARVYDREAQHLNLFFDAAWAPVGRTVSFGHDIEASWLIWEAAETLGMLLPEARACALALAEATLREGVGPAGEVWEERHADGAVSRRRVWWIQAEALVGFLNAYQMTGEARFLEACARVWRFIQDHQIDRGGGEWLASSALDPPAPPPEPQAGPWKCPYHTGRAMMELERRARALLGVERTRTPQQRSRA